VKAVTVRVEDELWLAVKQRALAEGVTLTEVVTRLLAAYTQGAVKWRRKEEE
jgi:predicted DNA binding CopG/RHH family protein